MHARPEEQQAGARVGSEFAALAALDMRAEHEAVGAVRLQQHHPHRRPAPASAVASAIAVGSDSPRRDGLREQGVEGGEEIGAGSSVHARIVARMVGRCTLIARRRSRAG